MLLFAVVVAGVAAVLLFGELRWRAGTRALRARLDAARLPPTTTHYGAAELAPLPAPVQRYFRATLEDGRPVVAAAHVTHTGTFNLSATAERWRPFTSDQRVVTRRPGFDWDARISMAPGVRVHVHDAYIAGEGILHAAVLGLVTLADLRGTGEVARGELMRFFAEAAWYPTALLPSQGVRWEGVDDRSARATLTDGGLTLTLRFHFGDDDLIDTIDADARGRAVGGAVVPTPWHGRFWNYAARDGMRVPLDAEVAWRLPEGTLPYWRGHITQLRYTFAR